MKTFDLFSVVNDSKSSESLSSSLFHKLSAHAIGVWGKTGSLAQDGIYLVPSLRALAHNLGFSVAKTSKAASELEHYGLRWRFTIACYGGIYKSAVHLSRAVDVEAIEQLLKDFFAKHNICGVITILNDVPGRFDKPFFSVGRLEDSTPDKSVRVSTVEKIEVLEQEQLNVEKNPQRLYAKFPVRTDRLKTRSSHSSINNINLINSSHNLLINSFNVENLFLNEVNFKKFKLTRAQEKSLSVDKPSIVSKIEIDKSADETLRALTFPSWVGSLSPLVYAMLRKDVARLVSGGWTAAAISKALDSLPCPPDKSVPAKVVIYRMRALETDYKPFNLDNEKTGLVTNIPGFLRNIYNLRRDLSFDLQEIQETLSKHKARSRCEYQQDVYRALKEKCVPTKVIEKWKVYSSEAGYEQRSKDLEAQISAVLASLKTVEEQIVFAENEVTEMRQAA